MIGTALTACQRDAEGSSTTSQQSMTTTNTTTVAATTTTSLTVPVTSTTAASVPDAEALHAINFGLTGNAERPSVFGFGHQLEADAEVVLETISVALGEPHLDTGWSPMPSDLACTGAISYRSFVWGDLRIVLNGYDLDGDALAEVTVVAGWSIGNVALTLSPPLDGTLGAPTGLTTASGIGIGTPKAEILSQPWVQIALDEGDRVVGVAASVVVFELNDNNQIAAIWVEDNDC